MNEPKKYTLVIDEYALDSLRDLVAQARDGARGAHGALLYVTAREKLGEFAELFASHELRTMLRAGKFIDQFDALLNPTDPPLTVEIN